MRKVIAEQAPLFSIILWAVALPHAAFAQTQGVVTQVYTVPAGLTFSVDGQYYTAAASFSWPAGSKHTLLVAPAAQTDAEGTTQYAFTGWATGSTSLGQNPLVITADPSFSEFHASFSVAYALRLQTSPCAPGPAACTAPGTIYVNGSVATTTLTYFASGSVVTLQAAPNAGFVFAGWQPGVNQVIQGFIDTVTMNGPETAYPIFVQARSINFATSPPGLQVMADRAALTTPTTLQWGFDTTHSVGPVSPQQDSTGAYWAFSYWSDGGAAIHAYQVAQAYTPDTLTAAYVPAAKFLIVTSPPGMTVNVDGRGNWPANTFVWGSGETHHLEAVSPQTDAQGRQWGFVSWSNGASAVQDFTVPSSSVPGGMTLTATFQPYGRVTVNSSISGVAIQVDGSSCPTPCDIQRPAGTQVRLSAPSFPLGAGTRADFLGWADGATGDRTLTLGTDVLQLTANYHVMNQLMAASDPPNGATWQMQPRSADGFYDSQTTVNVRLSALPGFRFRQWTGDLNGSSPSGAVSMNAPRTVKALLDRVPYIAPAGVANAAAATPQPGVAPGSIVSIFGGGFGTNAASGPTNPMVQSLAGVTVTSGNRILPLFFASPTQINFLLPSDFPLGQANLTVSVAGQPDLTAPFAVVPDAPGLFPQNVNGQAFAVIFHADGTPVTASSPATAGELLTLYGTGFGPTSSPRPVGFPIPNQPAFPITDPATVTLGNTTIAPQNAFAVPGQIGVDAIQFQIADTSAWSGTNASLLVTINGQNSNTVLLPVQ